MELFSPVTLISFGLGESAIQTENDPQSQRVHSKFENRQILEFRGGLSGNLQLVCSLTENCISPLKVHQSEPAVGQISVS